MKTRNVCLLVLLVAGCAKSAAPAVTDLAQRDASGSNDDLSTGAGDDLARADGPSSGDGGGLDGSTDLAGRDLSTPDLSVAPDLSTQSDLAGRDFSSPPDLTTPPDLTMPCSVFPQSGCGAGEKCTLGAGNAPTCASNGNKTPGQQCGTAGADDCIAGDLCTADAPAPAPAICRGFCSTDANCPNTPVPSGATPEPANVSHCTITITGTPDKVCTVPCNPVSAAGASGCVAGQACVYGGATGVPELTDCETAGPAGNVDNFNCGPTTLCAPGFACVGPAGMSRCRQLCRGPQNPHTINSDCSNGLYDCYQPSGVTNPMFGFCCHFITGC